MPCFVIYEVAPRGAEKPFAYVSDARDANDALACIGVSGPTFVARETHRATSGDVLCAQYRMRVRAVASRPRA